MFGKNRNRVWLAVGVALAIAGAVALLFGYHGRNSRERLALNDREPPWKYTMREVEAVSIPLYYRASGVIGSEHEAEVSAQISGVVTGFDRELGEHVQNGTPVVRIKADELQARKAEVQSRLVGAETQKELALSHLERTKDLYSSSAATLEQLEQAQHRASEAEAKLRSTKEQLKEAEVHLGYSSVMAPFDGIIGARYVDPGDYVRPGSQLFSIYDPSAARLVTSIPERYVDKLNIGLETEVDVYALDQHFQAKIAEIRPHLDPKTRSFVVKSDIDADGKELYPGMFGTLVFQTGQRDALVVPLDAIITLGQLHLVWVRAGRAWQKRYVTLGAALDEERVEVLSGLSPKDRIAVRGALSRE